MSKRYRSRTRQANNRRKSRLDENPLNSKSSLEASEAMALAAFQNRAYSKVQRQQIAGEIGQIQGNRHLQQLVLLQRDDDPAKDGTAARQEAKEKLMEHLSNELQGKPKKNKDAGKKAIESAAKAALKTKQGKQLTRYLFSRRGAPVTLMLGSAGLATAIATNTGIPSIPIPLSDKMKLTLDLNGPIRRPQGVMVTFELKW